MSLGENKSKENEKDLRQLLERAQKEDAEWLRGVFGDKLLDKITSDSQEVVSMPFQEASTQETVATEFTEQEPEDSTLSRAQKLALMKLGYSVEDVQRIKRSVLDIIVERQVQRPRRGLPPPWLVDSAASRPVARSSPTRAPSERKGDAQKRISRPSRLDAGPDSDWDAVAPMNTKPRREQQVPQQRPDSRPSSAQRSSRRPPRSRQGLPEEGVGEAFTWRSGVSPRSTERASAESQTARGSGSGSGAGRSGQKSADRGEANADTFSAVDPVSEERQRWTRNYDDDEPSPFWPDKEEFKDMLLDESQWRVNIIGDWVAPLVREETKWRYNLYKNWLAFLDEGLGDRFDVVPEEFDRSQRFDWDDADDDEEEDFGDDSGDDEGIEDDDSFRPEASPRKRTAPSRVQSNTRSPRVDSMGVKYESESLPKMRKPENQMQQQWREQYGGDVRRSPSLRARAYEQALHEHLQDDADGWTELQSEEATSTEEFQKLSNGISPFRRAPATVEERAAWFGENEIDTYASSAETFGDDVDAAQYEPLAERIIASDAEFRQAWVDSASRKPIPTRPSLRQQRPQRRVELEDPDNDQL